MHLVVLGAGVIGVTTAYQLLLDGHQVTVMNQLEPGPTGLNQRVALEYPINAVSGRLGQALVERQPLGYGHLCKIVHAAFSAATICSSSFKARPR